jgi:hypothetical protein
MGQAAEGRSDKLLAEDKVAEAQGDNACDEDLTVIGGLPTQAAVADSHAAVGCGPSDFPTRDSTELQMIDTPLEVGDLVMTFGSVEHEGIGSTATVQNIIARSTTEAIVARTTIDYVVTGPTKNGVVAVGADKIVVFSRSAYVRQLKEPLVAFLLSRTPMWISQNTKM